MKSLRRIHWSYLLLYTILLFGLPSSPAFARMEVAVQPAKAGAPLALASEGNAFIQFIGTGERHTCGLRADGSLGCWGYNVDGQTIVPALPGGLTYVQVSAGGWHTCGLRSDGSLVCWGRNFNGQATVPALPGGLAYTQVGAGNLHTCGLRSDGSLVCWGRNLEGQATVPALPSGLTYTQVSGGVYHTCGLRSDGSLVCWGTNTDGQTSVPALPGGLIYTQVSAGWYHTCGLRSDGSLICWGRNIDGQSTVPALPSGLTYTQVSAGLFNTCGLRSDGSLRCWGTNTWGQATVPALPDGLTYTQTNAGAYHACGLRSDASLKCWGFNGDGQTTVPVNVYGLDATPPSVSSITLANPSPTRAASVDFSVTFSEYVVGVNAGDFTPTVTGSLSGVSVNTGSGEGTLRLDVINDGSIRDAVNHPLAGNFTTGDVYTIDHIAPVTSLDTQPANPSASANASFTFSSTDGTATFTCNLDGSGYSPCTSPMSYTGLGEGPHTFSVRAADLAGNLSAAAAYPWTIDLTPPTAFSFVRQAPSASTTNADTLVFRAAFSEAVNGVGAADFAVNGSTTATVTGVNPVSGSLYDVTVSGGNLAGFNGVVGLDFAASPGITDLAGNAFVRAEPATDLTYTLDNTAPNTSIGTHPADPSSSTSATFTFSGTDNVTAQGNLTFACSLDGVSYVACSSSITYTGLSAGSHFFSVRAADEAGNVDPSPATFIMDD